MSKMDINMEQLRQRASDLHRQLDEAQTMAGTAMCKAYEDASVRAKELAASLRTQAQSHQSDAAAHYASAASSLESASAEAKKTLEAKAADLRDKQQETLHQVRNALQGISHGVAAARSTQTKART